MHSTAENINKCQKAANVVLMDFARFCEDNGESLRYFMEHSTISARSYLKLCQENVNEDLTKEGSRIAEEYMTLLTHFLAVSANWKFMKKFHESYSAKTRAFAIEAKKLVDQGLIK